MNEKCGKCGSALFLYADDQVWCPNCNGIEPLNKEDSLELCRTLIDELDNEINSYCQVFSFDYLLELAYQFRENKTKSINLSNVSWDLQSVVAATLLIKKVLSGYHGETNKKYYKSSLNNLIKSILEFISVKNAEILINEEYGHFFVYSDVNNWANAGAIYSYAMDDYFVFVPKVSWGIFEKNAYETNVARRSKVIKLEETPLIDCGSSNSLKNVENPKLTQNIVRMLEIMYNSFHFIYFDEEMFTFAEIDNNEEVLRFFTRLTNIALERIPMFARSSVVRIPIDEFFEIADKYKYDSKKLFQMFVSTKDDIKNFPILIAHKRAIILSPETMFLLTGVLDYKLNKDAYNSLISGDVFEHEVELELNKLGFITDDPINKGKYLRNRKIKILDNNGKLREREIDLLAYNGSDLLVIECKEWRPKPKIFWKFQQDYRVEEIIKEIDSKHLDRVNYVKTNYKARFGFVKDLNVKGILVTRIQEDIEEYNGIKIFPKYELSKFINY